MATYLDEKDGRPIIRKIAKRVENFYNCQLAQTAFADQPWMTTWLETDNKTWFTTEYYGRENRLDKYKAKLDHKQRVDVAADILHAALIMYLYGLSHRDIHAKNVFVVEGQIKIIDFEYLVSAPTISFWDSYDVTGLGMDSPGSSGRMCFTKDDPMAILKCLGITLEEMKTRLQEKLMEELIKASGGFHSRNGEHSRNKGAVYASFGLPGFRVPAEMAQRDTEKRLKKLEVKWEDISDKRILDLGCNIGAVLFSLQQYNPKECVGIEYCEEMVRIAKKITAFAGYTDISFNHYDIDEIIPGEFEDYDTVFALAINKHVKDPQKLYQYLGRATAGTLYFEANAGTDPDEVFDNLRKAGFAVVERLGVCDDDIKASNNNRLLFKATK